MHLRMKRFPELCLPVRLCCKTTMTEFHALCMHKITGQENRERLVASLEETSVEQGDSQWVVTQMTVGSRVFGLEITSSLKESRDPYIPLSLLFSLPPPWLQLSPVCWMATFPLWFLSLSLNPIKNPVSLVCHINIVLEMWHWHRAVSSTLFNKTHYSSIRVIQNSLVLVL